jgi:23S rRNA pseudouridine2605 synthase
MKSGGKMRIQKFLSDAGVASRRKAEELVEEGAVLINDEIVTSLPAFVDPQKDRVVVRGAVVKLASPVYLIMHKPKNVVCTGGQKAGRSRVVDLLPPMEVKVNPVGRLDPEATGLVLLTNDGDTAQRVAHPRYEIPKRYRVEIRGQADGELVSKLLRGTHLSEGKAKLVAAELDFAGVDRSVLTVTSYDDYPRVIQRIFAKFGHEVRSLQRIGIGPLVLKNLPPGGVRELTRSEIRALTAMTSAARRSRAPRRQRAMQAGRNAARGGRGGRPERGGRRSEGFATAAEVPAKPKGRRLVK